MFVRAVDALALGRLLLALSAAPAAVVVTESTPAAGALQ